MTVRVLLVGEGPSELGHEAPYSRRKGKRVARDGYFQPILRRLLDAELMIDAQRIVRLPRRAAGLPGHADRAAAARALANTQGYDLLVYVKDVDRQGGARASASERRKKLREVATKIQEGLDAEPSSDTLAMKATPCRMLECWALADADCLEAIADPRRRDLDEVPDAPEDTWGDEEEADSGHPKCVLRRVLGRPPTGDDWAGLGHGTSFDVLAARCPDSFPPFRAEALTIHAQLLLLR